MTKTIERLSPKRAVAIAISCAALVAVAIGPAFAANRSPGASTGATGSIDAQRLRLLLAESVDADTDELAELDGLIDPDGDDAAEDAASDPTEVETPEPAETPDAAETPEPAETPHVKATTKATTKVTTKVTSKAATRLQASGDNDDQGDNEQNDEQENDHNDGGGEHDGGDSGGD
jgi:hypothetical protein